MGKKQFGLIDLMSEEDAREFVGVFTEAYIKMKSEEQQDKVMLGWGYRDYENDIHFDSDSDMSLFDKIHELSLKS